MEQPKIGTRIEETRIEEIQRKNKRRNKGNTGTRMRGRGGWFCEAKAVESIP